jgi:exportin-1
MVDAAAKLLDFTQPLDVPLLDLTLNQFYGSVGSNEQVTCSFTASGVSDRRRLADRRRVPQRSAAESILRQLQEHPEAWTRVDTILEHSKFQHSKVFALQVPGSLVRSG